MSAQIFKKACEKRGEAHCFLVQLLESTLELAYKSSIIV